jgi:inorganic phosphate transporter, PiT family
MLTLLIVIIVIALVFDVINGFHDAANSIATVVSTRVLSPFVAVIWAAFFNFVAFWIFDLKVADTVAKTVHSDQINLYVILAGLLGATFWNLLTWYYGIPSSSSHTLIGAFAGAAIAHAGSFDVVAGDKIFSTFLFIFLAPIIGLIIAYFITILILHACRRANPHTADKWFRRGQLLSSAAFSIGHGGSDSQKVMGIITAALLVFIPIAGQYGYDPNHLPSWMTIIQEAEMKDGKEVMKIKEIPFWIVISCYSAIAAGTMMGGWRIVKTMGTKITKVTPLEGVAAETAGAITLYGVSQGLGVPVSTTHTITGSIVGVGVTKRLSAVKWGVTINLIWAWILTIPVSGLVAALMYWVIKLFI